ncbi:MAG: endonuclease [Muribaculaceae bacterium]|nr:endonuclease [Muribaculaceae bacterium]
MNFAKKFSIIAICCAGASAYFSVEAEAPSGYYDKCQGKTGQALLKALFETVGDHKVVSYNGLYEVYKTSDVYPDGKIWDMYSTKHWSFGEKCGSYKYMGDCYNREHSMPKSWFNDAKPMYSDAFHLYPTDGKVNGLRSNYPFGECSGGKVEPAQGSIKMLGRCGTSTFPGYSGKVFEPDDQYKGDFARTYFYMAAAYNDRISTWNSDMLAHNNYPVFTSWSINLLLKWHRQDQVSEKETTRNDAVYKYQNNRNPFIDHPELVEYIWGTQVGEPWYPGGKIDPAIASPADGSAIDLGKSGLNVPKIRRIAIAATGLTENMTVSLSGDSEFKISGSQLTVADARAGRAYVEVTLNGSRQAKVASTLTISSGKAKTAVKLIGEVVDGIPAETATEVTSESFNANWVNVSGDGVIYSLDVKLNGESLNGYPRNVYAEDESEPVTGLQPETTYTYSLSYGNIRSNVVSVTTAAPTPSITFLYDGETTFNAVAGEPSDVFEIRLDVENVATDITINVDSPFQLSSDKTNWTNSLKLNPEEDRFYMRLFSETAGVFNAQLEAEAGDYTSEDVDIVGVVAINIGDFMEGFETGDTGTSYADKSFTGDMCDWYFVNAGVFSGDNTHEGKLSVRFGKAKTPCYIEMRGDKVNGAGTVSFYAEKWSSKEARPVLTVDYSTDGGQTWTSGTPFEVTSTTFEPYSVTINKTGNIRIRINRTSGARFNLDALSISSFKESGVDNVVDYHTWDAYCADGKLVIENSDATNAVAVYGVDGVTRFEGLLPVGETRLSLTPGLYIVVVDDFSRRVLVK